MRKDPLFRFSLILFTAFIFFYTLYLAKNILIPMCFAALLAMLLYPVSKKLEGWKFPRWLAILVCLLTVILIIAGYIFIFTSQLITFIDEFPKYENEINSKIETVLKFLEKTIKVSPNDQMAFVNQKLSNLMETSGKYIKTLFLATTGTMATISIVVVYTFLFLYFRDRFKNFILKIADPENEDKTRLIIAKSSKVTSRYLMGVFIVVIILSTLNSIGLTILGLDYAIFFGIMVSTLNIIPYIGVPIGATLPIAIALITKDSFWTAAGVAGVIGFNQIIDHNLLTPNIVGNQVNLNPLATIITLIIGASIWGIPGMIIFIPFLGIIKITLDHIEPLKPYAYLIGSDERSSSSVIERLKAIFSKKK